jgi:adenylate cyclase class 2
VNTEPRQEIEVKLRIDAAGAWRERLAALGAEPCLARAREFDLVFDTPASTLRAAGVLLRLRRRDGGGALTLKRPVAGGAAAYKVREEIESGVSDPDAVEAILLGLGLSPCFAYEKFRAGYRLDGALVLVDETPIGDFLEIEGEPAAIERAAARLGFSRADFITASYRSLFLQAGGSGDMLFRP